MADVVAMLDRCVPMALIIVLAPSLSLGGLSACAKDETGATPSADDASAPDATGRVDAADASRGEDAGDAGVIDGPGKEGAECSFNRDCKAALRCECSETSGCACRAGARGTGRNGIDPCSTGNACQSSVCVEGPPDSGSFCSDECKTSANCTGQLPLCSDVALVGRICIRTPPK